MDDPWGSPWATAEGDHDQKPPSPSKPQLELPRPTFAKLPSFSTHSPWGDENDGFGDWASADQGTTSGNGWSGWTGENGSNSSQQLTPMPRDDALDKASPIAWPGSIATSPNFNLKPVSRRASSVFRQHSPDPWATEFSLANAEPTIHHAFAENTPSTDTTVPIVGDEADAEKTVGNGNDGSNTEPSSNLIVKSIESEEDEAFHNSEELKTHRRSVDDKSEAGIGDSGNETDNETKAQPIISAEHSPETRLPEGSTVQSQTSRPSSPDSDDSHHDEDRQDSPITSIDEDSRSRLQVPRKPSYKVQELVERFDALAKSSEDDVTVRQERSRSRTRGPDITVDDVGPINSKEDEDADFGDFEDAVARQSRRPSMQEVVASSPEHTHTSQTKTEVAAQQVPLPESRPTTSSEDHLQGHGLDLQQLIDKFGPIKFETSLEEVNKLFDDTKLAAVPVLDSDGFVPDYVVKDSFTNISERKTWYRVSRQGTMRKHNMGNDENYRRVGWSNSTARIDTIKIVRRWMEEDSFSGRPTLGGPSGKGHGFGWDSGAEPVTLDQVFGKKRRTSHVKSASAHRLTGPAVSSSITQPLSPKGPPGIQRTPSHPKSGIDSSMGNFGWSTASMDKDGSLKSPTTSTIALPRESVDMSATPRINGPQIQSAEQVSRPIAMPPPVLASLSTTSTKPETENDDDDDWGDMVMSPAEDKSRAAVSFEAPRQASNTNKSLNGWHLEEAFGSANADSSQPANAVATKPSEPVTVENNGPDKASFSLNANAANVNAFEVQTTQQAPSSQDPWGFADFSTFDSTIPSMIEQKAASPKASASFSEITSHDQQQTFSWEPSFVTPGISGLPNHTSMNEDTETQAVRDILEALPDLSYMLR